MKQRSPKEYTDRSGSKGYDKEQLLLQMRGQEESKGEKE